VAMMTQQYYVSKGNERFDDDVIEDDNVRAVE